MKKAVSLILALVLCLTLSACGQSTGKGTKNKVYLDGREVSITSNDICNFSSKYMGQKIRVTGVVERVEGPYYYIGSKPYFDYYDITLSGGWEIRVHDEDPIISIINIGSTLTAEGYIMEAWASVLICGKSDRGWDSAFTEVSLAK